MSNSKVVMSQAANTLTALPNVEDVFSTYLFSANNSTQQITNDIDLDGEGGLVWLKSRTNAYEHGLYDTERGVNRVLYSDLDNAEGVISNTLNSFNSDGFTLAQNENSNFGSGDSASWTFRKAPKFFDVVTYTGTGSGATVNHNLGATPACVIIKSLNTSGADDWYTYHVSVGTSGYLMLNQASGTTSRSNWISVSDSSFTVDALAGQGSTDYVAYLFAHNDGDGGFNGGDIIKCGSYTGNGSSDGPEIDLGFEPQWVLVKKSENAGGFDGSWSIIDNMRGFTSGGDDKILNPNSSQAELTETVFSPLANGFKVNSSAGTFNGAGASYIYIAIRRGTKVPESGTEVFEPFQGQSSGGYVAGFPVDMFIAGYQPGGESAYPLIAPRLTAGSFLTTSSTAAESSGNAAGNWDNMTFVGNTGNESDKIAWLWKRAPNFFDVVAYTGDGVAGRTVSHNLGVAPEMIWVKRRDSAVNWPVYAAPLGATKRAFLNLTNAFATDSTYWNNTEPTSTEFTVGTYIGVNASGGEYIAYLFSSLAGISKVGSYTGNGGSQTIDCGFTSGARFVLIRASNSVSNWYVFDTERGIVVGNDPYLSLNTTNAEQAGYDHLTPDSSGFTVTSSDFNANGQPYLFYAIA